MEHLQSLLHYDFENPANGECLPWKTLRPHTVEPYSKLLFCWSAGLTVCNTIQVSKCTPTKTQRIRSRTVFTVGANKHLLVSFLVQTCFIDVNYKVKLTKSIERKNKSDLSRIPGSYLRSPQLQMKNFSEFFRYCFRHKLRFF